MKIANNFVIALVSAAVAATRASDVATRDWEALADRGPDVVVEHDRIGEFAVESATDVDLTRAKNEARISGPELDGGDGGDCWGEAGRVYTAPTAGSSTVAATAAAGSLWHYAAYLRCHWFGASPYSSSSSSLSNPLPSAATTTWGRTPEGEGEGGDGDGGGYGSGGSGGSGDDTEGGVDTEADREASGGTEDASGAWNGVGRRLLGMLDGVGARRPGQPFATRSYEPMRKYLRRVQVRDYEKHGKTAPTIEQVNGLLPKTVRLRKGSGKRVVTIERPRTAEAPFMTGNETYPSSRVHQVNGGNWPSTMAKCRTLHPHDQRPCVALANGGSAVWGGDG